jgi:hypothetical protein
MLFFGTPFVFSNLCEGLNEVMRVIGTPSGM